MSIFPKRTLQGKTVTIHWSVALESEHDRPLFPFVRTAVKSPDGELRYLYQNNLLLLPKYEQVITENEEGIPDPFPTNQNLARNIPLLILADYLSGNRKKEQLVEILTRIKTARHFYFTYTVADDAPLGKYELISELYLDGKCYKSLTADEDFFYVEKINVQRSAAHSFDLINPSPEECAVKVIDYSSSGAQSKCYTVPAKDSISISVTSHLSYALYNEEREIIALKKASGAKILRNQTLHNFEKNEGESIKLYVLFPDNDEAYILEGTHLKIWKLADGTVEDEELKAIDEDAFSSMIDANLLHQI